MLHPKRSPNNFRFIISGRRNIWLIAALVLGVSIVALLTQPAFANLLTNQFLPERATSPLPNPASPDSKIQLISLHLQNNYLSNHSSPDFWASSPLAQDDTRILLRAVQDQQSPDGQTALTALRDAPPALVPLLINALIDDDPVVRRGAAIVLGVRGAPEAQDPLFFATFDADATVRAVAVVSLGQYRAWLSVPRLESLKANDPAMPVRNAATQALEKIYAQIAGDLGVTAQDIRAVAIAPDNGRTYVATVDALYGPRGLGWERIGDLPGEATALAVSDDGQTIFLGTRFAGVFRSRDGGVHWQAINTGLPTQTPLRVTRLKIEPTHPPQIVLTLESREVYSSLNGGDGWSPVFHQRRDTVSATP